MIKTFAIKNHLKILVLGTLLTASVCPVGAEGQNYDEISSDQTVNEDYSPDFTNRSETWDSQSFDRTTSVGNGVHFTVNGDSSITTDSDRQAAGLYSGEDAIIKLNGEKNTINVTGYSRGVYGIHMYGSDTGPDPDGSEDRLHVTGDTNITVTHKGFGKDNNPNPFFEAVRNKYTTAQGILDETKGRTVFDGKVDIKVTGSSTTPWLDGILQRGVGSLDDTKDYPNASNDLTFNDDVTINVSADALFTGDTATNQQGIKDNALTGVQLLSMGGDYTTTFNGNLDITVSRPGTNNQGDDAMVIGLYTAVDYNFDDGGEPKKRVANFNGDVTIHSTNYGIQSRYGLLEFDGDTDVNAGKWGVYVPDGGISFKGDLNIKPTDPDQPITALRTDNSGQIAVNPDKDSEVHLDGKVENVNGNITVDLTTDTSYINGNVDNWNKGSMDVNIDGAGKINGDLNSFGGADDDGKLTANINGSGSINGNVNSNGGKLEANVNGTGAINGNLDSTNGGTLDVNIDGAGTLTGSATAHGNSELNVGLTDGAEWSVWGNSDFTGLKLGPYSIVEMARDKSFQDMKLKNLSGTGGIIILGIDGTKLNATDVIHVSNNFNGTIGLALVDINSAGQLTKNAIDTVLASTNDYNVNGEKNDGKFEALTVETPLHWLEYLMGHRPSAEQGYTTDWFIDNLIVPPTEELPPTVDTIVSGALNNYYIWRDNDKLMQRLGDLRQSKNNDQGIWARIIRRGSEYDDLAYFRNHTSTLQLGYDKVVSRDDQGSYWLVGGAVAGLRGNSSYRYGSGENSGATFSLYGTRMGNKGHYLDIVAKVGKYNNHFNSRMINGYEYNGDFDTLGYSVSAEYGRKKDLNHGWYVEPQMQLTLGHLNSNGYVAVKGQKVPETLDHPNSSNYVRTEDIRVRQSGINSAIGRIGFNIGRDIGKTNLYLKVNLHHEFGGRGQIFMTTLNDSREESLTMNDTWITYGLGVASPISKDIYMYFDIERSSGSNFTTDWQWNAGLRFKV